MARPARSMSGRSWPSAAPQSSRRRRWLIAGPHVSGGLWLSFWEHVEVRETPLEAAQIGRALRSLHDGLAEYRGPLPPRSDLLGEIDWLLSAAFRVRTTRPSSSAERDRVAEIILKPDADPQPIHGDASFSNLLVTRNGPRWNDLEDVCIGSVEWDVASLVSDARDKRGEAFSAEVLAAYGREFDPADARATRSGVRAVWRPMAPISPPRLRENAGPVPAPTQLYTGFDALMRP